VWFGPAVQYVLKFKLEYMPELLKLEQTDNIHLLTGHHIANDRITHY